MATVSAVRRNRTEAGGKSSRRGTRIASGVCTRTSSQYRTKSNTTKGCRRKCGGDVRGKSAFLPGEICRYAFEQPRQQWRIESAEVSRGRSTASDWCGVSTRTDSMQSYPERSATLTSGLLISASVNATSSAVTGLPSCQNALLRSS